MMIKLIGDTLERSIVMKNKIPKKIHYVWVGGNPIPPKIKRCMNTWKKHLKDFEIIEWNEKNFDINSHPFCKAAYEAKKWAYVSDYIRAYAIYNEGGVYLDTDNIVVDDIDDLLINRAFVGYENDEYPFTACFGAEKHHPLLKKLLDYYDKNDFRFDRNDQLKEVNTKIVANILINDYGCKIGNIEQLLDDDIKVYKKEVLCTPSKDSKVIHVFTGTWMEGIKPLKRKIVTFFKVRIKTKKGAELYQKYISKGR